MENYLRVGVITTTHGLKGEVKVFSTTDDINRFKELKEVTLDTGNEYITLEVEGVKFFKQNAILKFKGIDNIDDVSKYRGKDLLVNREYAVKLNQDEHFIYDLIDFEVFTDMDTKLGILVEILTTPANDVYVVKMADNKEILLPAIKDCILDIDTDNNKITVHVMPGLM